MNKLLLAALLVTSGGAQAGWFEDTLKFAAGLAAGVAVHELGHVVIARAYGERLEWSGGEWECRAPCRNIDKVALAGNLTTAIVGEALLHTSFRGAFVDGVQTFNTVNPISYAYKNATTAGGYLDYRGVDDRVQIALALHAASIGYRHAADGKWRFGVAGRSVQWSINF